MNNNEYNNWGSLAGEALDIGNFTLSLTKTDGKHHVVMRVSFFEYMLKVGLGYEQALRIKDKIRTSILKQGCFGVTPSAWIKIWED